MTIRFICPSCSNPIEVDDEQAGESYECTSCRADIQVPAVEQHTPAPSDPTNATEDVVDLQEDHIAAKPADATDQPDEGGFVANDADQQAEDDTPDPALESLSQAVPATKPAQGRHKPHPVFAMPRDKPFGYLWLGLMLIFFGFVIKHIAVSLMLSGTPAALELPRLIAERDGKIAQIELEYSQQLNGGKFQKRTDPDDTRKAVAEIRKDYAKRIERARVATQQSGASTLGWIQAGIWVKIVLDLPKLIGCGLVLLATFPILTDPLQNGHVKTFSICCATVVMIYSTLYAIMAFMG